MRILTEEELRAAQLTLGRLERGKTNFPNAAKNLAAQFAEPEVRAWIDTTPEGQQRRKQILEQLIKHEIVIADACKWLGWKKPSVWEWLIIEGGIELETEEDVYQELLASNINRSEAARKLYQSESEVNQWFEIRMPILTQLAEGEIDFPEATKKLAKRFHESEHEVRAWIDKTVQGRQRTQQILEQLIKHEISITDAGKWLGWYTASVQEWLIREGGIELEVEADIYQELLASKISRSEAAEKLYRPENEVIQWFTSEAAPQTNEV
jgi:hypothetical protein